MTGYLLDYILDSLTLSQLMMIHNYGIEFEEIKSIIFLNKYAEALSGKKKSRKIDIDKPPPKYNQLKAIFGDKVKKLERK